MDAPKLIKIKDVLLYVDRVNAKNQTTIFEAVLSYYGIGSYHQIETSVDYENVLHKLQDSSYGPAFVSYPQLQLPVVTWKEFYDDFERFVQIAITPEDLMRSSLVANTNLIC